MSSVTNVVIQNLAQNTKIQETIVTRMFAETDRLQVGHKSRFFELLKYLLFFQLNILSLYISY